MAVILLLTSLCHLRIQTLSAWIPNSSFHVLTATSISPRGRCRRASRGSRRPRRPRPGPRRPGGRRRRRPAPPGVR
ncbi:hypothetical protein BRC60_04705 [Halobacteriales archaeon QH_1_68_42]|nr:MAG: hypothetical protein BRC60_04705 [Halobacteriales archaeon QH_1_68_42]